MVLPNILGKPPIVGFALACPDPLTSIGEQQLDPPGSLSMSGQHVVFVRSTGVAALERSVTERLDRLGLPRLPADEEHDGPSLRLQVLATPAGWVTMRASPCWFWWAPGSEDADLTAPHATWFEHLLGEQPSAWLMATHVTYIPGESVSPRHVLMETGAESRHLSAVPCEGEPGLFAGQPERQSLQPRHPLLAKPWDKWRKDPSAGSPPDEAMGLSLLARNLSRHLTNHDVWMRPDWSSIGGSTWRFALPKRNSRHMPLWTQPMEPMPRESQPAPLPTPEVNYVDGRPVRVGDAVVLRHSQRNGHVVAIMQVAGVANGVVVRVGDAETGQRALWTVRQGVLDEAVCLRQKGAPHPTGLGKGLQSAGTALPPTEPPGAPRAA